LALKILTKRELLVERNTTGKGKQEFRANHPDCQLQAETQRKRENENACFSSRRQPHPKVGKKKKE